MSTIQTPPVITAVTAQSDSSKGIPPPSILFFPPFPTISPKSSIIPFSQWTTRGIYLSVDTTKLDHSCDSKGQNVVLPAEAEEGESVVVRAPRLRARVARQDCWKIGQLGTDWVEPDTSQSNYDPSIPPFTRLISATRDFLYSRHQEFQFARNKRLFDLLRFSLGLRTEYEGSHWPGSGPNAIDYEYPSKRGRFGYADSAYNVAEDLLPSGPQFGPPQDEACVLLRQTVRSVRGFLALARREAEAGWDIEPAIQLAEILSAFLSFIVHYQVFTEPILKANFIRASELAKSAPDALRASKFIEDAIADAQGINVLSWQIYGETRLDNISLVGQHDENTSSDTSDDGGWKVENEAPLQESRPTIAQAIHQMGILLDTSTPQQGRLRYYIPYSRRRIIACLPPHVNDSPRPSFGANHMQLITVPSPWTPEEKWRSAGAVVDDGVSEDNGIIFEKEIADVNEPDEICISVYLDDGCDFDWQSLVGVGLRGRWGMVEVGDISWWIFQEKDYTLPSFWQSEVAAAWAEKEGK